MVVPAYAVLAIALGRVNFLLQPVPALEPAALEPRLRLRGVLGRAPGRRVLAVGPQHARLRRASRWGSASRSATRSPTTSRATPSARKTLLIVLLVIPFWVSYLLRMLAWIGLLAPDGYVNQILQRVGIAHPPDWLDGNAVLGDPGARLRLHPVLHPARVRGSRPDRPAARSRPRATSARPRSRVPARDAAAQPPERARRVARWSCCRCSATTTPTT